jgi:hypothetical protein
MTHFLSQTRRILALSLIGLQTKGHDSMQLAKIVHIVSTSPISFDDAVKQGVINAAKTLRGISGVKVTDWTAKVENDDVTGYKVTMDVAFAVEGS